MGESALLVTLGEAIDPGLSARARAVAAAIDADARLGRAVPAYASVLVPFDPVALSVDEATSIVESIVPGVPARARTRPSGAWSRSRSATAARRTRPRRRRLVHDLAPADVVDLHAGVEYTAFFLGFAPGFAYLGPVPASIATPRLDVPRPRVPAGSVAIGGAQTAVYPTETPGGWRLIGRTDARLWDVARDEPALIRPGDRVRFVPLT